MRDAGRVFRLFVVGGSWERENWPSPSAASSRQAGVVSVAAMLDPVGQSLGADTFSPDHPYQCYCQTRQSKQLPDLSGSE